MSADQPQNSDWCGANDLMQPPVDNAFVAEGCEKFTDGVETRIDLNAIPSAGMTADERAFIARYGSDGADKAAALCPGRAELYREEAYRTRADIRIFTEAEIRARLAEMEAERGIES